MSEASSTSFPQDDAQDDSAVRPAASMSTSLAKDGSTRLQLTTSVEALADYFWRNRDALSAIEIPCASGLMGVDVTLLIAGGDAITLHHP